MSVKLTPAQKRVLSKIAAGQAVSERPEWHVATRLEDSGLITNVRCSVAFNKIFTYYELTPAGRTACGPLTTKHHDTARR